MKFLKSLALATVFTGLALATAHRTSPSDHASSVLAKEKTMAESSGETGSPKNGSGRELPGLDLDAPSTTQTATFALG